MMAATAMMTPTHKLYVAYASRQPDPAYIMQTIVMRMTIQFRLMSALMRLTGTHTSWHETTGLEEYECRDTQAHHHRRPA